MGMFDWLTGYRAKLTGRDRPDADWGGPKVIRTTQSSVLGLAAAWACVRLKSRVVGSLPLTMYRKDGSNGRVEATDHWLYGLLHDSPNSTQTPYDFWSNAVGCIDLWGNAYAEKSVGTLGRTVALQPLRPDFTKPRRNAAGELVFDIFDRGKVETLPAEKVLHLPGLTLGGDVGLSAINVGAESLGGAVGAVRTAAETFVNGLQLAGFMETGNTKLSPEQRADLIEIFEGFRGQAMRGRIVPLEKDFKFAPLRMNPAEAQLLETRGLDIEEVCRWFDTPPILIGHAAKGQTMWGSGVEQILLGWLTMGLNPLLTSIQQRVRKQLLPPAERVNLKPEFNREGLLAADSAGRAALYSALGQNGVMTRNEMRAKENLAAKPGGDTLTVQSNLVPLDKLGEGASPQQDASSAVMKMIGPDMERTIDERFKALLAGNSGGGRPFPEDS
jgi:HK97 family phage portal protein